MMGPSVPVLWPFESLLVEATRVRKRQRLARSCVSHKKVEVSLGILLGLGVAVQVVFAVLRKISFAADPFTPPLAPHIFRTASVGKNQFLGGRIYQPSTGTLIFLSPESARVNLERVHTAAPHWNDATTATPPATSTTKIPSPKPTTRSATAPTRTSTSTVMRPTNEE